MKAKGNSVSKVVTMIAILVLFLVCMVPSVAMTETYVAKVGDQKYTSWKEAWEKVESGGTIELLEDWKISTRLHVNEGAEITVKLNGHTIDRGLSSEKSGNINGSVIQVEKMPL